MANRPMAQSGQPLAMEVIGLMPSKNKNNKPKSRGPGRKHTKPLCVIYSKNNCTFAALVDPNQSNIKEVEATGPYAALGIFRDQNYTFGDIFEDRIPAWVNEKIPKGAKIVGVCQITGFPLI